MDAAVIGAIAAMASALRWYQCKSVARTMRQGDGND
jgi:hypothetical protein